MEAEELVWKRFDHEEKQNQGRTSQKHIAKRDLCGWEAGSVELSRCARDNERDGIESIRIIIHEPFARKGRMVVMAVQK